MPYQVNGKRARRKNIRHFTNFTEVLKTVPQYDGMVFFTPFAALDTDKCAIDGQLSELAEDMISTLESYTENSPQVAVFASS